MIRHGIGLALGFALLAGSASTAGELDSDFGPRPRTPQAVVAPERPDLTTRLADDREDAAAPRASELDREAPAQAHFRGFGYGRGFGGFGYRGFGGFRSFGIGLGFGGFGSGYGGYGSGYGGFGFPGYGYGYGGLGYGGLGYGGFGYPSYGYGGFGYPGYGFGGFALNIGYGGCYW